MSNKQRIGKRGEAAVIRYARSQGWIVLSQRYRTWQGEIDCIIWTGKEILFIEVKTRRRQTYALAEDSLSNRKVDAFYETVGIWLQKYQQESRPWRALLAVVYMSEKNVRISFWEL